MNNLYQPTLAYFDMEAFLGLMIPIIALIIPIVAILVRHQQKMAEIIHGQGAAPQLAKEIEGLRYQIQQLHYQVGQQAAALQKIGALNPPETVSPSPVDLQERLRS